MKEFTVLLLCTAFVALIGGYAEYVNADHLIPGPGIFNGEQSVELVTTKNSEYQVYLQVVVRDGNGSLINVIESSVTGAYIPHTISDHIFYNLMGVNEVITIDNTKYEKAQYTFNPTLEQRWIGLYPIYSESSLEVVSDPDSNATIKMNSINKDYSLWKIHYCATFENHGYSCIPAFQALVPNITMEPDDYISQQWTILREIG